jgi:hypothetical protein
MKQLAYIEQQLKPFRNVLKDHYLYGKLAGIEDIKIFMEQHVYPVWDFMSLLKSLQIHLTCTQIPWTPAPNATLARFINDIVKEEESDLNELGEPRSHFEMYLEAMQQVGANTAFIERFVGHIKTGKSVKEAAKSLNLEPITQKFLNFTFATIDGGKAHEIASAFAFGREELIPDMFLGIIDKAEMSSEVSYSKLTYYLKRHIELDGDDHGPLALKMIAELCGNDDKKWEEVLVVAKNALKKRIELWDRIAELIEVRRGDKVIAKEMVNSFSVN